MVVTGGGFYLKNTVTKGQDRNIKGSATKVIDEDGSILLFVDPVCQCACGGFVDDAHDIKAGNLSGIFGCLAL